MDGLRITETTYVLLRELRNFADDIHPGIRHITCVTFAFSSGGAVMYSLWHIPSSTLMMVSSLRDEVERFVESALGDGLQIDDMMLQFAADDDLLGKQYLGPSITELLRADDTPGEASPRTA